MSLLFCFDFHLHFHSKVAVTTANNEEPRVREARSVGDQLVVHPVDCVLSEWSLWSRCDTCQKKRVSMMIQIGDRGPWGTLQVQHMHLLSS